VSDSDTVSATNRWSEENSATFIDLAAIFVPGRGEQTATLLDLIPAERGEQFTIVELASGEGVLAEAIMERFPHCRYVALDGSSLMRERTAQRVERFRDRLEVRPFEIAGSQWRAILPHPLRCVLSSLCVHHLSGEQKQQLFKEMRQHLEPGGALLLADIIEPASQRVANLFSRQYEEITRAQSLAIKGDLSGFEQFQQLQWNYFAYDYGTGQTFDQPSLISDQLLWLREAGFSQVDCYWMRAGHAVYGGYK
jgi:tRNA (cmo5U34)-methyltransferase